MEPPLNDDVTSEIFLRLPADEPEHLFRAALVCRSWLRVLCDAGFPDRYRAFHGARPLLGVLLEGQGRTACRFISTTSTPEPYLLHPPPDGHLMRLVDCRHGRLLIRVVHAFLAPYTYFIWDPLTGVRQDMPAPYINGMFYDNALVLCAADGCDHLHCHGGPFRVVILANGDNGSGGILVSASVYSSVTGAWSAPVSPSNGFADSYTRAPIVIRDEIYFAMPWVNAIIKYSLRDDCLSRINPPPHNGYCVTVMAMENNLIGFACIEGSGLRTWSRNVHSEGATEWVQFRVVELEAIVPIAEPDGQPLLIGCAEGLGITFISTVLGLFMIKLNSGEVKKIAEPGKFYRAGLPYLSFYIPGML